MVSRDRHDELMTAARHPAVVPLTKGVATILVSHKPGKACVVKGACTSSSTVTLEEKDESALVPATAAAAVAAVSSVVAPTAPNEGGAAAEGKVAWEGGQAMARRRSPLLWYQTAAVVM